MIVLIWYGLSNSIILTTKWLYNNYFSYPLTVTLYYNGVASILAAALSYHPKFRSTIQPLSRAQFFSYVLPIGVMTALEIGASNVALRILSVSFGTILKGMGPIFTFLWGLVFGLETFSWRISICLFAIAFGIVIASLGEGHEFELLGFCLQLFSTCLGGLRWATTHRLLLQAPASEGDNNTNSHTEHMSALNATVYTAPTTTLSILPVALILEGAQVVQHELAYGVKEALIVWTTMTVIASWVFCLIMSEYWLVGATSSLALSVAAVFKELLTIGAGILLFSDHVDLLNVTGFSICQVGILSYVYLRYDSSVAYEAVELETHHGNGTTTTGAPPEMPPGHVPQEEDDPSEECFVDETDNIEMSQSGRVRHRVKHEDGHYT
uniref:Sugar phosphate transporter domain-containing protein n=1 Tax=Amphora coffeiformis TaxID=265554 RepID=A0A7S3LBE5_9STRA|eukprot:scaffold2482_cov166-Amphora_coffeaeformis.AAC.26